MSSAVDSERTDASERREYHGHHVTWCTNQDAEFTGHSEEEPYCSRLIHAVDLIPEGDIVKAQMWAMPTAAFTHGEFTPAERAERERRYDGIELTIEVWRGGPGNYEGGDEQRLRLNSDAARTLAATLIRAADIEQGLTR